MAHLGAIGFVNEIAIIDYDIEIAASGTAVTLTATVTIAKRGRLETWRVAQTLAHWDDIALP